MFLDEYECALRGGKGGDGCVSFRREKKVPRGGPDGGDGGAGGSVILLASPHHNTLYHLTAARSYEAQNGQPGTGSNCTGRDGDDLVVPVPVGTVVLDAARGNVLRDLTGPDERFVIAKGGRGGRGNTRFAHSTNRTPRQYEPGQGGELRTVRLSLKLIADVGLVGVPNAGKSTLISVLSRARPKIADYPFTTLQPCLGIVVDRDGRTLVMADIPGLIEGAHEGRGLGDQFLKHVERTRVLLHLVDCSSAADIEPVQAHDVIVRELAGYSAELAQRPRLVVATKVEDEEAGHRANVLEQHVGGPLLRVSAVTRQGLDGLVDAIWTSLASGSI